MAWKDPARHLRTPKCQQVICIFIHQPNNDSQLAIVIKLYPLQLVSAIQAEVYGLLLEAKITVLSNLHNVNYLTDKKKPFSPTPLDDPPPEIHLLFNIPRELNTIAHKYASM